jgi:hypothetical protein
MANLASAVWQDATTALLLGVHGEQAPSDAEWDHYCSWVPALMAHPNGGCVVFTDGGAPTGAQRETLRRHMGKESLWTAVVTDKVLVRGVVTAIRWFNLKVCAFAPWELPAALKFVGAGGDQIRSICDALVALDKQLEPRSRVLAESVSQLGLD